MENRIRQSVKINDMQFGFRPGVGTIDAIFIARQLQERLREKQKELWMAFVDLEKAYDRVPREVVRWALRKSGVEEWLVRAVMAMYEGTVTRIRSDRGSSDWFEARVGLHQGSVLSPLLFIIVLEAVTEECRSGLPWELFYADDLALAAKSEDGLKVRLRTWTSAMKKK